MCGQSQIFWRCFHASFLLPSLSLKYVPTPGTLLLFFVILSMWETFAYLSPALIIDEYCVLSKALATSYVCIDGSLESLAILLDLSPTYLPLLLMMVLGQRSLINSTFTQLYLFVAGTCFEWATISSMKTVLSVLLL